MKIIILAAGKGQRYSDAGFTVPKPLIYYNGKCLIDWALQEFSVFENNGATDVIVVGTLEVCRYVRSRYQGLVAIPVAVVQKGPAMSALLAGGFILPSESVVIMDCDVLFYGAHVSIFSLDIKEQKVEAGLLVTRAKGDTTTYCGVYPTVSSTDKGRLSIEVGNLVEKAVNAEYVAVGVYGFKRWEDFREAVMRRHLQKSASENSEIYISHVLQSYLLESKQVYATKIPAEDWKPVGSPKELQNANT